MKGYYDNCKAYKVTDSEGVWLHIVKEDGFAWEEQMKYWELVLDMTNGKSFYRQIGGPMVNPPATIPATEKM